MPAASEGQITGRHVFIVVAAFFAVVIGANLTLAVFASRSWTGLIVPNAYVASQTFDRDTADQERLKAMGVQPVLSYENGRLRVAFTGRDGLPVTAGDVKVRLGRPAYDGEDRTLPMLCAGSECNAETALGPGVWQGEVMALVQGAAWRAPVRLVVKGS